MSFLRGYPLFLSGLVLFVDSARTAGDLPATLTALAATTLTSAIMYNFNRTKSKSNSKPTAIEDVKTRKSLQSSNFSDHCTLTFGHYTSLPYVICELTIGSYDMTALGLKLSEC